MQQYKTNINRLQKWISKDITIRKWELEKYCNDMELSEGQGASWCTIRSVLNLKTASYNYPTQVSRDEGVIKIRSVTTAEKLETFASQLEGVFTNEIENNVFDEEVKTDIDTELDQPIARARLNQKVIPFDPDIHPDRIRFCEVTDILMNVNTRKACDPDHITNKIIWYLIPALHIIKDLLNIGIFHGYHPRAWKRADGPQSIQKEIRPMLLQGHFPSLLPKQSVQSHHDQAVNELGWEHWQTAHRAKRV